MTHRRKGTLPKMTGYFRRVFREGDKLRSVHIGASSDALVQLLKRRHRLGKATQKAHQGDNEKTRAWLTTIDDAMDCYSRQLNSLLRVWLRVHSISICRDGSWQVKHLRKRKGENVPVNMTKDDFDELVVLAGRGKEQAEESLLQLMREDRHTWRPFGDLSGLVQKQLLSSITGASTGGDLAVANASLEVSLEELRTRLRRGISDPLRDLAIDQIVMAHLDTHRQALLVAEPEQSRTMVNHNDQRMKRSQSRLQAAIEFLAKVDRMLGLQLEPVASTSKPPAEGSEVNDANPPASADAIGDPITRPVAGVVKTVFVHPQNRSD